MVIVAFSIINNNLLINWCSGSTALAAAMQTAMNTQKNIATLCLQLTCISNTMHRALLYTVR